MSCKFSERAQREFETFLKHYPKKQAALLPTLRLAESEFGHLSDEVIHYVAGLLDLTPAKVWSVASFYTLLHTKPVGRHRLLLCRNLTCFMMGAEGIQKFVEEKLGCKAGETTVDGKFTVETAECLAACDLAPCMHLDGDYHGPLTPEKVEALFKDVIASEAKQSTRSKEIASSKTPRNDKQ